MTILVRSAVIGVGSGLRSTAGLVALGWTARGAGPARPVASLVGTGAFLGECVVDKQPSVPPRTGVPQVLGRIGAGAVTAAALARRGSGPVVVASAVGALAAYGGSVAGMRWRRRAADALGGDDLPGALAEDLAALALALTAVIGTGGARPPHRGWYPGGRPAGRYAPSRE